MATSKGSTTVGVRELKNQLSAHLALVKAGQEVVVTEHGRPIAKLSPLGENLDPMVALVAAGIVEPPKSPHRHLPTKRVPLLDAASLDDDVAAQRR